MYPFRCDRRVLFENEIEVLNRLNGLFEDPLDNGIVELIDRGKAKWRHQEDEANLPGEFLAIIYTYGVPLFPELMKCLKRNDRKSLYLYFSQMVRNKYF